MSEADKIKATAERFVERASAAQRAFILGEGRWTRKRKLHNTLTKQSLYKRNICDSDGRLTTLGRAVHDVLQNDKG